MQGSGFDGQTDILHLTTLGDCCMLQGTLVKLQVVTTKFEVTAFMHCKNRLIVLDLETSIAVLLQSDLSLGNQLAVPDTLYSERNFFNNWSGMSCIFSVIM